MPSLLTLYHNYGKSAHNWHRASSIAIVIMRGDQKVIINTTNKGASIALIILLPYTKFYHKSKLAVRLRVGGNSIYRGLLGGGNCLPGGMLARLLVPWPWPW